MSIVYSAAFCCSLVQYTTFSADLVSAITTPRITSQRLSTRLAFQSGLRCASRRIASRSSIGAENNVPFHRHCSLPLRDEEKLPALWGGQQHRTFFHLDASRTSTSLNLARGRSSSSTDGSRQKNNRNSSSKTPMKMPRGVKKENLPSKICATCGRPFTWRKKWERVWDEVTTCSKSCNHKRRLAKRTASGGDNKSTTNNGHDDDDDDDDIYDEDSIDEEETFQKRRTSRGGSNKPGKKQGHIKAEMEYLSSDMGVFPMPDDAARLDEAFFGDHSDDSSNDFLISEDTIARQKEERKAAKKALKAERRAQREGRGDGTAGQKECDMCGKSVDLLIRCKYMEGQTNWSMVCGKCWKVASGGVVDGDEDHPHYRYGGLWKNRRASLQTS